MAGVAAHSLTSIGAAVECDGSVAESGSRLHAHEGIEASQQFLQRRFKRSWRLPLLASPSYSIYRNILRCGMKANFANRTEI